MRNPSPISTSSPLLITISRPAASAVAASTRAAALLLTTWTPSASGTARASASIAPRPRRARAPDSRSNSTSVAPAATVTASTAAGDSGARPRFVWSSTPVMLTTGRRLVAWRGSAASATSATSSGSISPCRTRCCACTTASLTAVRPSRSTAATSRGSASTASVRGTRLRGSTLQTTAAVPGRPMSQAGHAGSSPAAWRRRGTAHKPGRARRFFISVSSATRTRCMPTPAASTPSPGSTTARATSRGTSLVFGRATAVFERCELSPGAAMPVPENRRNSHRDRPPGAPSGAT